MDLFEQLLVLYEPERNSVYEISSETTFNQNRLARLR